MRKLIALISFLVILCQAQGRTLYVDAAVGDPSYDGLSPIFTGGTNGPKKSPQQAINLYQPGDTISIANGYYNIGPNSIIDLKTQNGITIIGQQSDSVILDATGRQFGISISTSTTNPIRDITIKNLTVYHTDGGSSPANILIWKARNVLFENIKVEGSGQFNAPGANAVGIKVMESDTVELRNIDVSFCEGNGIEFGGGTGHITLDNISILAASTDLSNAGIFFRTSAAGIYPGGNLQVSSWTGLLELDSCYNGVIFESQNGTISINFGGSSIIEDNIFLDGASFGSSPPPVGTLKQMGFDYLGTIGVLPGAETYFAERQDLIDLTVNPAYVTASIASNIERTQFYLAGDMLANLAVNSTSPGDTLIFLGMDFSDVDLQVNKPLHLWAENNRTTLNSLNVNGNGAEARLINNFITEEELVLTNGILFTDAFNRIIMRPGCVVVGGSDIAYVDGPIQAQTASITPQVVKFPCGFNGTYRPVSMTISSSTIDTGTYRIEMKPGPLPSLSLPASVDTALNIHYWDFSAQNASNFQSAVASIAYNQTDGVNDPSSLRMIFKESPSGNWTDIGGSATGLPNGNLTGDPISTSGLFAIANATGGGNFTGIEDLNEIGIEIFPNPSNSFLQFRLPVVHVFSGLYLINSLGQIVHEVSIRDKSSLEIDVENLPKGLYHLHFMGINPINTSVLVQ